MSQTLELQLYNTLTRRCEPVVLARPAEARVYCCGVTPYDTSHAGHGRTAVFTDLLIRHLRESGVQVRYVRNVTDVDDKILKRAREVGEEPLTLSARFFEMYKADVTQLGCVSPEVEPRVSTSIEAIVRLVQQLIDKGVAYTVASEHGTDVWYAVRAFDRYGRLSGREIESLRCGAGLEERDKALKEGKRDPLDFALWKSAGPDDWAFESPWGRGRPGWHIECSAMVEEHLGFGIDIHAGGMDLIFPHHENEIAQSEGARPDEGSFARCWIHGGFLNVNQEKMAKSLGNFVTMRDCFARNDPEALRYFFLTAHYRGPLEFEAEKLDDGRVRFPALDEAERRLDYLYLARKRLDAMQVVESKTTSSPELKKLEALIEQVPGRVRAAMNDDLNAPMALAAVGELARAINDLCDLTVKRRKDTAFCAAAGLMAQRAKKAFGFCSRVLGILELTPEVYFERTKQQRLARRGLTAADVEQALAERSQARHEKNWTRADEVRQSLLNRGVEFHDSPEGTVWSVLPGV